MTISSNVASSAFYQPAIFNLSDASNKIALSVNRLSSGNRLVNAGDDVAALSISTRLTSQTVSLRQAKQNAAQSDSLLQVAYGGLTQIRDIMDEMNALAVQANSASLTSVERGLLQTEFSSLSSEIDRIADNTAFSNINLLDGSVAGARNVSQTITNGTSATGSLNFSSNVTTGETLILNGVTLAAGTDFTIGASLQDTLNNLVDSLTAATADNAVKSANYERVGNSLEITARAGGELGNQYVIDEANSTAAARFTVTGDTTVTSNVFTLTNGADNGLYQGGTLVTGTIGDSLVDTQNQTRASVTVSIIGTISDGDTLSFDDGASGTLDFTFRTSASSSQEIQIGADNDATLQNIISTFEQYSGSDDYVLRQLEFRRGEDTLTITNKQGGDVLDIGGNIATVAESSSGLNLSASTFGSGENSGVNINGVTNDDFVGTISGFSATYNSGDNVTASLTVGGIAYSATITDTTPASDTVARFTSANGGYFDVELNGGNGLTVSNSADATTYASRLDSAFSTLTFYQTRPVASFSGTGDLAGASAEVRLDSFTNLSINDIRVSAPGGVGADAIIEIDLKVNGTVETFRSTSGIADGVGDREALTLTSLTDSNNRIRLFNATSDIDISDSTAAATFQATLRSSFGLNGAGSGLNTQVGAESDDVINISIGDARTSNLFSGVTPDISTESGAENAQTTITTARATLNEIIASVGAQQARLEYASQNLDTQILGIDTARSALADTDVAYESTELSTSILRANVATAVIAQASGLQSSLLDLVRVG